MVSESNSVAEGLQAAICQAVAMMSRSTGVAGCPEGRGAHDILRKALLDYATYQPCAVKDRRCQSAGECQELGACNPRLERDERNHSVLRRLDEANMVSGPGLNQGVLLEQSRALIERAMKAESVVDDILCRMNEAPATHLLMRWKPEIHRAIIALRT